MDSKNNLEGVPLESPHNVFLKELEALYTVAMNDQNPQLALKIKEIQGKALGFFGPKSSSEWLKAPSFLECSSETITAFLSTLHRDLETLKIMDASTDPLRKDPSSVPNIKRKRRRVVNS
jgi:hypothetical protein